VLWIPLHSILLVLFSTLGLILCISSKCEFVHRLPAQAKVCSVRSFKKCDKDELLSDLVKLHGR